MKSKHVLEVRFQSLGEFQSEVQAALRTKTGLIQPRHQIFFDSVPSFRKFMTIQKIELLNVIANKRPASIYELAKLADRDFAAVLRDCVSLEETDFIKLVDKKDSKGTKVPRLSFDYSCIVIYLPSSPYQIEFGKAA